MKKWTSIVSLLLLTCTLFVPGVSAGESDDELVTFADLQENLDYLFPSGGYLSGLEHHSTWEEVERGTMSEVGAIEITYEALYDASPSLQEELPIINAYIIPYTSRAAAESQLDVWKNSTNFTYGTWNLLTEGTDYFSYYTDSSTASDLIKYRPLEEASLHLVKYYDNVVMIANFYRDGGEYVRGNVNAFLDYLDDYEGTLALMDELFIYSEEAMKFYLGTTYSTTGPSEYDYHPDSASYSASLSEYVEIPKHGTFSFDIYIDDGSEIGTIFDMNGDDTPATGSLSVTLNEDATLKVSLYADEASSNCEDGTGWHHLYTLDSLGLYDWQTVMLGYGQAVGFSLWIDGEKHDSCSLYVPRSSGPVYLGDYPGDATDNSFVGYLKDLAVSFSSDADGNLLDELSGELIFTDVSEAHRYAEAIEYLKEEGIIEGYANGTYRPEQSINRVEILKMLLLGFGYDVPADYTMLDFSDLEDEAWYLPYLNYAVNLGVVSGHPDGTYLPSHSLNRAEFLKILLSSYGIVLADYPITELYADTYVDAWYAPYVQYAKDNELMDTDAEGNFNPGNEVTRGEVAETIYRLITG